MLKFNHATQAGQNMNPLSKLELCILMFISLLISALIIAGTGYMIYDDTNDKQAYCCKMVKTKAWPAHNESTKCEGE